MVQALFEAFSKNVILNSDLFGRILKSDQTGRSYAVQTRLRVHGERKLTVLSEMRVGEAALVECLDLPENVANHLMHMGFVPQTRVVVLRRAPAGDPTVYAIDGMEIALRRETAQHIRVCSPPESAASAEVEFEKISL